MVGRVEEVATLPRTIASTKVGFWFLGRANGLLIIATRMD